MTDAQAKTLGAEVLSAPDPSAQAKTLSAEVLSQSTGITAQVKNLSVEVIYRNTEAIAQTLGVEALSVSDPSAEVQWLSVDVLSSVEQEPNPLRTTQLSANAIGQFPTTARANLLDADVLARMEPSVQVGVLSADVLVSNRTREPRTAYRIYLATLHAWDPDTETNIVLKFASGLGYLDSDNEVWYEPRIENPATYSLAIGGAGFAQGSYGEMTLTNIDGGLDGLIDYAVDDRYLLIQTGYEDQPISEFVTILRARMEGISLERERVSIRLRDPSKLLEAPAPVRRYLGTYDLEGYPSQKDQPKPLVLGETRLVPLTLVDPFRLIYQINDGPIEAVGRVVTKSGAEVTPGTAFGSEIDLLEAIENEVPTDPDYRGMTGSPTFLIDPDYEIDARAIAEDGNDVASFYNADTETRIVGAYFVPDWESFNLSLTANRKYKIRIRARSGYLTTPGGVWIGLRLQDPSLNLYGDNGFKLDHVWRDYSAIIDLRGLSVTSCRFWIWMTLQPTEWVRVDDLDITEEDSGDIVPLGYYRTWVTSEGSYLRLGSDPLGTLLADVSETATGGEIGLAPGAALSRLAAEFGHVLDPEVIISGSVVTLASTSAVLDSGASGTNGAYEDKLIKLTDADGFVQVRAVSGYVGSTKTASWSRPVRLESLTLPVIYQIADSLNVNVLEQAQVDTSYAVDDPVYSGDVLSGGTYSVVLDTDASTVNDAYTGYSITILSGLGAGQIKPITDYAGDTKTVTVGAAFYPVPDSSSTCAIANNPSVPVREASVGYVFGEGESVRSAMDAIAQSVHAWYGFDALGRLRMGLFRAPSGTPVATIREWHVLGLERQTDTDPATGLPNWRVTVQSGKRWGVLNQDDLYVPELSDLTKPWGHRATKSTPATRQVHPLSTERSLDSLLVDADGARGTALAEDLLMTYGADRHTVSVTLGDPDLEFQAIDIGLVVKLIVPRFGYDAGRLFRVIRLQRDYQARTLDLILWG